MDVRHVQDVVRWIVDAVAFDGQRELLAQVDAIQDVKGSVNFLELVLDSGSPPSHSTARRVPGACWAIAPDGEVVGTLVVWLENGLLSKLEYAWTTDAPPTSLPPTEWLAIG